MQYETPMTVYIGKTANQRKVTKWLSFLKNCNHHILEVYDHIHTKDEVSMTTYINRKAYKRKVPKWLLFENYKSE